MLLSFMKYNYVRLTFSRDGHRYEVYGRTREEAEEKKKRKLRQLDGGFDDLTVKEWSDIWLDTYIRPKVRPVGRNKEHGTMTAKSYEMYPQKLAHILPVIGDMKINAVRDIQLQRLLNDQTQSKAHAQKVRLVLRGLFSQAYASRVIEHDPSTKLVLPSAPQRTRRSLTDYERQILLQVAKTHRCGLWIRFLLRTGMRPGESAALKVKDVDFINSIIHITAAVESGSSVISTPKSKAGIRDVPILDDIKNDLRKHIKGKSADDFVFTQENGLMMTQTVMSNNWRSFSRQMDLAMGAEHTNHGHIYDPSDLMEDGSPVYPDASGNPRNGHKIAEDLVLYCLRHTFCTDMKRAGVPLATAKVIMGHEDISTTANIYMDSYEGEANEVARLMCGKTVGNDLTQS